MVKNYSSQKKISVNFPIKSDPEVSQNAPYIEKIAELRPFAYIFISIVIVNNPKMYNSVLPR